MEPIVLANGNSINVGHKWDVKVQLLDLFFDSLCILKNSMRRPLLLEFQKALFGSLSMSNVWSSIP
jgi:hypothetical protein